MHQIFLKCHCLPAVGRRATNGSVPARRSGFRHAGVAIRRSRCEGLARGNLVSPLGERVKVKGQGGKTKYVKLRALCAVRY